MKSPRTAALALLLSACAFAAPGDLDPVFVSNLGVGLTPAGYPGFNDGTGASNAVAVQSDGRIIVGGNVSRFNHTGELTALKRLNPDGTPDATFNAGGAGLAVSSGQPEVNALLVDAQDRIYVGGTFATYNGTARAGLVRLNPDGTLDESFATVGLGNGFVMSIAAQPDGKILVAGAFTVISGFGRFNVARLNADGSADLNFNANAVAFSIANMFDSVGVQPDGKILVSGSLNSRPAIARLNADGTLDASFTASFANDFGRINRLLVLPDGRILIGGDMVLPGTTGMTGLAALQSGGALDSAFMANLGSGPNGWTGGALVLQPDGRIVVSGKFTHFNGQPRASIARLHADGTLDATFAPAPYSPVHDTNLTHIYAVAVQPDARLVAGGWFDRITDPDLPIYNLTRFQGDFSDGPGTLRFSTSQAVTAENAGSVTLHVSRFGGLAGAVSVQYASANGTAAAGADYTAVSGMLSWAAGEGGVKAITVPILQDAAAEGSETFTVSLFNVTGGAALGTATVNVTIRDDDTAPEITLAPQAVSVDMGDPFTLTFRYDSVPAATVQWERNTGSGFADIPGATSIHYTVAQADPAVHAGAYRVRVTNLNGTTTSTPVVVTVTIPAGAVVPTFAPALPEAVTGATFDAFGGLIVRHNLAVRRITPAGTVDPDFLHTVNSTTSSMLTLTDGGVLIGGFFTTANGTSTPYLMRLHPNGVHDTSYTPALTPSRAVETLARGAGGKYYVGHSSGGGLRRLANNGTLDATFSAPTVGTGTNGIVNAVHELPDGRVLVGHTTTSGFSSTYQFQRLLASGAVDATFTAPALNWDVKAIEMLPDGRIAIAGRFSTVSGVAMNRVAILQADGALDQSFAAGGGLNGNVIGIAYRDGRLLAWGSFTFHGVTAQAGLARLNLDGTLDTHFRVGAGASPATVAVAAYLPDGNIALAGSFTSFRGVPRNYAAVLVGNPHIGAAGFAPAALTALENAGALTLTVRRYGPTDEAVTIDWATVSGGALAGEDFVAASGTLSWAAGDASDRTLQVQLINDTEIEPAESFRVVLSNPTGPITAAAGMTITITDDDTPVTITQQPVGASLLEGQGFTLTAAATSPTAMTFQWYRNGQPVSGATAATYTVASAAGLDNGSYFLRVTNAAGATDTVSVTVSVALNPANRAGNFNFAITLGAQVRSIAPLPGGGAYVAGDFTSVTGLTNGRYLFRVGDNGAVDLAYNPSPNSTVMVVTRQPDGKLLVGGNFTSISGVSRSYLARLNADGSPDTAFHTAIGSGPNSTVNAILVLPDGRIAVGGAFTAFGSVPSSSRLVLLNADGTADTTFASPITNGAVTTLAHQGGAQLLVGGTFSTFTQRLVRLSLAGVRDANFAPAATTGSSTVNKVLVLPDGRLALLGQTLASSSAFLILDGDTGAVAQNVSSSAPVVAGVVQDNGRLVTGGNFAFTGATRIARWSATGSPATYAFDNTFATGTGFNGTINAIEVTVMGELWIGGNFTTYNGATASRLVKLNGEPPHVVITGQPAPVEVNPGDTITFTVAALGTGDLAYEWRKDGVPLANGGRISGADAPVLAISGAGEADEGDYSVVVSNPAAERSLTSAVVTAVVLGAPEILVAPAGGEFDAGGPIALSATVRGVAPLTFQWQRNGQPVVDGGRISGATTAALTIANSVVTDGGAYTLTVTNAYGSVSTAAFNVSVQLQPAGRVAAFTALSANSTVHHVLPLPDGGALVGGNFTASGFTGANGTVGGPYLVRLKPDGEVDPTFTVTVNSNVDRFAFAPDGSIYVAGIFSQVSGVARSDLFRLTPQLTLDTSFSATVGISGTKRALAVDSLGRVYLGGNYSGFSSMILPILERYSPAGVKDTGFGLSASINIYYVSDILIDAQDRVLVAGAINPGTGSRPLVRLLPGGGFDPAFAQHASVSVFGTNMQVGLQSDGRIVVGSSNGVRRLTADGAPDDTFTVFSSGVTDIAVLYNDRIVAVGNTGLTQSGTASLLRFSPDGTVLPFGGAATGFNGSVDFVSVADNGYLWLGGLSFSTFNGQPATRIAVLNGDVPNLHVIRPPRPVVVEPGQTAVLTAAATGTSAISYQWLKDGVAVQNGGRISGANSPTLSLAQSVPGDTARYALRVTNETGGQLTSAAAQLIVLDAPFITAAPASTYATSRSGATFTVQALGVAPLAYQWRHNGVPIPGATGASHSIPAVAPADAGLYSVVVTNALGSATSPAAALSVGTLALGTPLPYADGGNVRVLAVRADGKFYVGGGFTAIAGHGTRNVARFHADGTVDRTFTSPFDGGADCSALAVFPDGKVYVYGPTSAQTSHIAYHHLLAEDGAIVTEFNGLALGGVFPGGAVYKAAVGPDGLLYLSASYASSANNRGMIARVSATGQVLAQRNGDGAGSVYDFGFLPDGRVVIVGNWTWSSVVTYAALLDTALAPDSGFSLALNNRAFLVKVDAEGRILVGGQFTQVHGVNRAYLVRVDQTGARDTTFLNGLTGPSAPMTSGDIALAGGGRILITGGGNQFNGTVVNNFVRINADGTIDGTYPLGTAPNIGTTSGALEFAHQLPSGAVVIGSNGSLTFKGASVNGLLLLSAHEDPTLEILAPPAASVTRPAGSDVTLHVAARGAAPLAFQWARNGTPISGATGLSLTIASLADSTAGSYTVTVTSGASSLTSAPAVLTVGVPDDGGGDPGDPGAALNDWLAAAGVPEGQRGPNDDPDGDGWSNLLEYALGLDPAAADRDGLPELVAESGRLYYAYFRVRSELVYEVETSTSLTDGWTTAGVDQGTPEADGLTLASVAIDGSARFMRLKVTRP